MTESRAPKVLIVDDEATNIVITEAALLAAKFEVATASDGEEAMRKVASFHPDLVLMDIQMPGKGGLEVTRELKADPATQHIRIVAFTGLNLPRDKARMRKAGCDGYLSKPVDAKTLCARVLECLTAPLTPASPDAWSLPIQAISTAGTLG